MKTITSTQLIEYLCNFSLQFRDEGRHNELLKLIQNEKAYISIDPLFSSPDEIVLHTAIWITSEFGRFATPMLPTVKRFLRDPDVFLRSHAIDIFTSCADAESPESHSFLIIGLDDESQNIRVQCMRILCALPNAAWMSLLSSFNTDNAMTCQSGISVRLGAPLSHEYYFRTFDSARKISKLLQAVAVSRQGGVAALRRFQAEQKDDDRDVGALAEESHSFEEILKGIRRTSAAEERTDKTGQL